MATLESTHRCRRFPMACPLGRARHDREGRKEPPSIHRYGTRIAGARVGATVRALDFKKSVARTPQRVPGAGALVTTPRPEGGASHPRGQGSFSKRC
jgi:hypothetical protein